jgi:hypothetical protein
MSLSGSPSAADPRDVMPREPLLLRASAESSRVHKSLCFVLISFEVELDSADSGSYLT